MDYRDTHKGYLFLFSVLLLFTSVAANTVRGPEEYCADETFTGKCADNEVILISSALYGRLKLGKCVKKDMGFLGCSTDVQETLNERCSGRSECHVDVHDFYNLKPCEELSAYLNVTYQCITVNSAPAEECERSPALLTRGNDGYISTYVAKKTGCGNTAHPWKFDVQPGQRVNITLLDFSGQPHMDQHHTMTRRCKTFGHITEVGHRNNVTICSKHSGENHVYTSNGRDVRLYLASPDANSECLLHYTVIGCADLKVPQFAWYKREGNTATVGCEAQDLVWSLTCNGNHWKGVIGNCSSNFAASIGRSFSWSMEDKGFQQIVMACIVMGFVIIVVVACIVIIIKFRESRRPPPMMLLKEEQYRAAHKGPLPPVPEDGQYRSLIRPGGGAMTLPHPAGPPPQAAAAQQAEWRMATWNKQNQNQPIANV